MKPALKGNNISIEARGTFGFRLTWRRAMLAGGVARETFTGAVHFTGWRHAVTAVWRGLAITSLVLTAGCGDWTLVIWHLRLWLHTGPQTERTGPLKKTSLKFMLHCNAKTEENFLSLGETLCEWGPCFHNLAETIASEDRVSRPIWDPLSLQGTKRQQTGFSTPEAILLQLHLCFYVHNFQLSGTKKIMFFKFQRHKY